MATYQVSVPDTGGSFRCPAGRSLLEAMLAQGSAATPVGCRAVIAALAEHPESCELNARDTPRITDAHPQMDWEDAYAVQGAIRQCKLARGARIAGLKAGLTSRSELEGPGCHVQAVLAATDFVLPGIEAIDSRYRDFKFDLKSVVADNCSSARFVVGGRAWPPGGRRGCAGEPPGSARREHSCGDADPLGRCDRGGGRAGRRSCHATDAGARFGID